MFFVPHFCFGQYAKVQGTVTDKAGKPLEGVTVVIENSSLVLTNEKGVFTFDSIAKAVHTLVIGSYSKDFVSFTFLLEKDTVFAKPFIIVKNTSEFLDDVVITSKMPIGRGIESLPMIEIDAKEIRRETGGSLIQTLEKRPGIKSIGIGSSNAKPLIRGLGFNQVAVIENGIKHEGQEWGADHGLEIDQYNVDKLEIIKGPSSFLYGSDALGGIINIKSNAVPVKNTLGGSVDLVGKSNNLHAGGSLNLYGRSDKWFFRLRSTYMNYADYRVPTDTVYIYSYAVGLHKNFVRNTAGREFNNSLNFGYVGTNVKSIFSVSHNFNKSGFFANAHGLVPMNVDKVIYDSSSRDILLPYQQVNHTKVSNQTEISLGKHKLEIEAGFQRNFRNEHSKYTAHGYMPSTFPQDLNVPFDLERQYDKNAVTLNVSDRTIIKKHSLSYGVNSEYQQNKIGGWGFLIPAYKRFALGGFVYDKFFVNDKLALLGALRYDIGSIHIHSHNDWFESDVVDDNGVVSKEKLSKATDFSKNFNNFSWSAGLLYTKKDWLLTVNVGKSFRMPIAKELAANGINYHYFRYEKGNSQLSPEQSYQLDLGVNFSREKFKMSVTPFVNYFSNYIFLNPTADYDTYYGAGNQIFEYTQAKVFRTGFEVQASYAPLKQLKIESGIEYLYGVQLSGAKRYYPLPFTPPASGIFSISYAPTIWQKHLTNSFVKLNVKIAAPQNQIVPPEKQTQGYHVWGFALGTSVKTKKDVIDIRLNIYNLFNQKYLNHTSFYRLIDLPEQGRNIVLSVRVPFNFKK